MIAQIALIPCAYFWLSGSWNHWRWSSTPGSMGYHTAARLETLNCSDAGHSIAVSGPGRLAHRPGAAINDSV